MSDYSDSYEVDTTLDMRQPLAILMFLRLEIIKHMNELHGWRDRFAAAMMAACDRLSDEYEEMTMLITTPMPFPYVHLCKVMLVCMLLTMPLATDASDGFFSTVFMPGVLAFSLLGIDAIATELSDPFGTDCNDLDVTGRAAALESECLMFLDLCGDPGAIQAFQTYTLNSEDIPVDDARCPTEFLCLRREVSFGAKVGQNSSVVCATSATASLFGARLGE